MADTLCGPSNPLQTFQKHASVDRALERDRLVSRQSPVQGFRTPNPNAGILDAEFETFVAGEPVAKPFYRQQEWQNHRQYPATAASPQRAPDWALDFQNLHVGESRATPLPSARFREAAPLQRGSPGSLQQDFLERNKSQSLHSQFAGSNQGRMGFAMPASNFGISTNGYPILAAEQQPEIQPKDMFNEEAFEKAFDAAHLELQDQHTSAQQQGTVEESQPTGVSAAIEESMDYRIGSDRIVDDDISRQERSDAQEADELARTAGHLLENVKHDQSAKFRGSNFLSLMRQLRDKEVKVEGANIVQAEQPLHPGGPGYPYSTWESLPANEEIGRPRPTTSRIRASSVPRQRQNGHFVQPTQPGPTVHWSAGTSDTLKNPGFDAFLQDSA